MLFLAFKQSWSAFHVLFRYSALINDNKTVNTSSGRHLEFFLYKLVRRHQDNQTQILEEDEELMVLLSGDLQAGTNRWVWGNSEIGTLLSRRQKHSRAMQEIAQLSEPAHRDMPTGSLMFDEGMQRWEGWQWIYQTAKWLEEVRRNQQQHRPSRPPLEPPRSESKAEAAQRTNDIRSRMTIASITDL